MPEVLWGELSEDSDEEVNTKHETSGDRVDKFVIRDYRNLTKKERSGQKSVFPSKRDSSRLETIQQKNTWMKLPCAYRDYLILSTDSIGD
jgi:hypothetical protein